MFVDNEEKPFLPTGVFLPTYCGNSPCAEGRDFAVLAKKAGKSIITKFGEVKKLEDAVSKGVYSGKFDQLDHAVIVVSVDGILIIQKAKREILHNIVIKAVCYSGVVECGNFFDFYCFVAFEERRNIGICHLFACEKGQPATIILAIKRAITGILIISALFQNYKTCVMCQVINFM